MSAGRKMKHKRMNLIMTCNVLLYRTHRPYLRNCRSLRDQWDRSVFHLQGQTKVSTLIFLCNIGNVVTKKTRIEFSELLLHFGCRKIIKSSFLLNLIKIHH